MFLSCATKIRTPLNRMVTPETTGGFLNSEVQFAQVSSAHGKFDVSSEQPYPLELSEKKTNAYWWSFSLLNSLDFFWWHTSGSPSLFGVKYQILGTPLTQNPQGQSLSVTFGIGGNEHESETNPNLKFTSTARDVSVIYGLWLASFFQINTSLYYTRYMVTGKLTSSSDSSLNSPINHKNTQTGLTIGPMFRWGQFNLKLEYAYNMVKWSESSNKNMNSLGLALGFTF